MREVATDSVDLVFSGQNIEHLPLHDVVGFLCEARRVLRPRGVLVIDSPNRGITERLGWFHPEHVFEFTVDEIVDLVCLAGFDTQSVRGLWQCYDARRHRLLPLDPEDDETNNRRRVDAAIDDPENAFVWWLTAQRGERSADRVAINTRLEAIAAAASSGVSRRFFSQIGMIRHRPLGREALCARPANRALRRVRPSM